MSRLWRVEEDGSAATSVESPEQPKTAQQKTPAEEQILGAEGQSQEHPKRPIDRIPSEQVTDEQGNTKMVHHWEQAEPGDTYDALSEIYHGNADRVKKGVQNRIGNIDKAIKGVQKKMDAIDNSDDFDAVAAQSDQYDQLRQQKDELEQQKKWAEKIKSGNMTKEDYAEYRKEYNDKMQDLKTQTQNLASAVGYDGTSSSQKATANGISSITYEQANNIVALTTAGNISRDQVKDQLTLMNANMEVFKVAQAQTRDISDELRTIQANSYIELKGIHEDTSAMNKAIKSMSGDVSEIKKHIKNM